MKRLILFGFAAALCAACYGYYDGPNGVTGTPNDSTSNGPADIIMRDSAFAPAVDTVALGSRVTWRNLDSVPHTVTSDTGSVEIFDSGTLFFGESFSRTFRIPGTVRYFSRGDVTPGQSATGMRGVLVIQ